MDVAIVGLPGSGKSTVFNAVTRGAAQVAGYGGRAEPNVGVAKVPDARLDALATVYQPKRVVPSEVSYIDLPPPPDGFGRTRGISGEYLNRVQAVDVMVIVARAFEDESVVHVGRLRRCVPRRRDDAPGAGFRRPGDDRPQARQA